jgi:hypothetical protein
MDKLLTIITSIDGITVQRIVSQKWNKVRISVRFQLNKL